MRLLVTRPQADGERTAARLRARGHHVTLAPLLRIEPVDFEFPRAPLSAVVITSANAARAIARHSRREALTALTAFTVGRHTAEAAHSTARKPAARAASAVWRPTVNAVSAVSASRRE